MAKTRQGGDASSPRWRFVAPALFILALGLSALTFDDPGLAWDEPFSILAGNAYAAWVGELPRLPFGREAIDRAWGINHEHPPLAKLLMGISQALLGKGSPILASRLAVAAMFAVLVELVFKFGSSAFGRLEGLVGALSLMCMPRVFGHSHLAALDLPMALAWLVAVVAFARAVERGTHRACALSGLCFGLALLTKINAVFLPLVLIGWGLGFHGRRALRPLAWTLLLGPAVFVAGWPWLWHETGPRLWAYVRPAWRVAIPLLYFGRVYGEKAAPWHYPVVLTLTTLPVGILFIVLLGGVRAVRGFRRRPLLALMVINLAVTIGVFVVPGMPKYDGVRLFLAAFPFLALLGGVGGRRCWDWVAARSRGRPWRPLFASAAFFLSQAGAVALIHPFELSYYNALVGGLWGADKLGLETTYWHECVNRDLFRWLNRRCTVGQQVAFYPVGEYAVAAPDPRTGAHRENFYDLYYLSARKRLRAVRLEHARRYDFLVLNAREAMLRRHPEAWRIFTTQRPIFAIRRQGVTLCAVYGRQP